MPTPRAGIHENHRGLPGRRGTMAEEVHVVVGVGFQEGADALQKAMVCRTVARETNAAKSSSRYSQDLVRFHFELSEKAWPPREKSNCEIVPIDLLYKQAAGEVPSRSDCVWALPVVRLWLG